MAPGFRYPIVTAHQCSDAPRLCADNLPGAQAFFNCCRPSAGRLRLQAIASPVGGTIISKIFCTPKAAEAK
jgi:hypothetical protein